MFSNNNNKIWLKVRSSTQLHWRSFTYSRSWRTTAGQNLLSLCAHSDWLFTKINTCSPEHTHTHTHTNKHSAFIAQYCSNSWSRRHRR